jgi:hypothetical protein
MITEQGFQKQTFNDLKNRYIAELRRGFEVDPNQPTLNVASNTPLGHVIDLRAKEMADIWDLVEFIYNAIDLDSASGILLDMIGKIKNVRRIEPTPPRVLFTFYKKADEQGALAVPSGTEITDTNQGIIYRTDETISSTGINVNDIVLRVRAGELPSLTIHQAGIVTTTITTTTTSASGLAQSLLNDLRENWLGGDTFAYGKPSGVIGAPPPPFWNQVDLEEDEWRIRLYSSTSFRLNITNLDVVYYGNNVYGTATVLSDQRTEIASPLTVPGFDMVANLQQGTAGIVFENDTDYRNRLDSLGIDSIYYTEQAIQNVVSRVPNVTSVSVRSNRTEAPNDGMPPYSLMVTVVGGTDAEVAQAIALSAPPGIEIAGEEIYTVQHDGGNSEQIRFSRPKAVFLYIRVFYRLQTDEPFPETGETDIVDAILIWARGEYTNGRDVIPSRLFTPVNTIRGISDIEIQVGVSAVGAHGDHGPSSPTTDFDQSGTLDETLVDWSSSKKLLPPNMFAVAARSRIWVRSKEAM